MTQEKVNAAVITLEEAIQTYKDAQKPGTKEDLPVPLTITSYNGSDTDIEILKIIEGSKIKNGNYKGFEILEEIQTSEIGIVNAISSRAFELKGLSSVIIPDSIAWIGSYAFSNNNIESLTIPRSVINIGSSAFKNNIIESLTILDSEFPVNRKIQKEAFLNTLLSKITIPDNVALGDKAFTENQFRDLYIIEGGGTYIRDYSNLMWTKQ